MVPKPNSRDKKYSPIFPETEEDQIVISGIAGQFPNSKNVSEFENNLYNKVDMVSEGVFKNIDNLNLANRIGKTTDMRKFDSTFFGVHHKQAISMDPQCRMLLETAYEAIIDAGINPKSLKGSNTGVFIATSYAESEKAWFYENILPGGFGITGCSRAMIANRISYVFGLTGPSFLVDTGGSGSAQALAIAYSKFRNGEIDSAIIGGTNLILFPTIDLQFKSLGMLSSDGFTRTFDKNSSGYNRCDAISCIFLQRKRNANRIYAHVIHCKSNHDGFSPDGFLTFSKEQKFELMNEFYKEISINPNDIAYIEANGNGMPMEDIAECNIIDDVICKKRKDSLLIGSVKSNIGHADSAAGVSSLVKVCLAFENGKIAPNLHFNEPRPEINALIEGRLKVVTESQKLLKPYIAINSYSYSGANVHVLLKGSTKEKINFGLPNDNLPRIICWAGRTEESVNCILSAIENKKLDTESVGLIHKIQNESAPQMVFRGYGTFSKDENGIAKAIVKDVQHYSGIKRPMVWVFSGMGSQWAEMGTALMEIPLFRESILKCHNALWPKGLNLIEIITSTDKKIFDNILHSFVGIASIQIALVDILRALNLEPEYIIGHSVGELGCGYADGGLTAEQMILSAYSRGKVSLDAEKIKGSMAAIGLGYNEIIKILPSSIEVACRNSSESSTISGPAEDVGKFVSELKEKEIFAREVPCSEIAYHSRYIAQMGPHLLKYLSEIIPNPKPRSEKWLSSSVPKIDWDKPHAQLCSAEYHTNNLLNSVLFEETADMLPRDALAIEIAPHGLLQAILKRSMSKAVHIGLTQRGHKNNTEFLLQSLGKIYLNGIDMPLNILYPKIEFPVSQGTINLSSLIKWDHAESWYVSTFEENKLDDTYEWNIILNVEEQHKFLKGNYIDDKNILPASYLLEAVINFFAKTKNSTYQEMNIEIKDVKVLKNIYLTDTDKIILNLMIHRGSGNFSITEAHVEIMSGVIISLTEAINPHKINVDVNDSSDYAVLFKNDIYKELKMRGHDYSDFFKSVINARSNGSTGQLEWQNSLTSFLDGIIQISCLKVDSRDPMVLTQIRKLNIFGPNHQKDISNDNNLIDINYNSNYDLIVAGGFEIFGLECNHIERRISKENIILEKTEFIPNFSSPLITTLDAIRCCIQIATENSVKLKMKIIEIDLDNNYEPIIEIFNEALSTISNVTGNCTLLTNKEIKVPGVQVEEGDITIHSKVTFVITSELLSNWKLSSKIEKSLDNISFIITQENLNLNMNLVKSPPGFNIINVFITKNKCLYLLKKIENIRFNEAVIIEINESDDKFDWIKNIQKITNKEQPIILYCYNNKFNGILGMVQCLRKDIKNKISCFFMDHELSPKFNIGSTVYENQLKLEMSVNVFQKGLWGTYRQILLEENNSERCQKVHFSCNIDYPGDLTTLNWYQGDLNLNDCNINVVYSSVNFRDMLLAIGRIPMDMYNKNRMERKFLLGIEFSGIEIKTGKRIMGVVNKNGLSPYIKTDSRLIWDIPKYWSLKDAATIPLAYSTVYYALFTVIKIKKNKSILIHCGTGSVGLAAITVCLAYDLEVYTTVSSDEKKEFLLKYFPQLKENHIGSSCNTSFEELIQEHTNNTGVNYVLNSLSGDKMLASTRCLGKQGVFIDLGKYDSQFNNKMGIGIFLREVTYHAISIKNFLTTGSDQQIYELKEMIKKDINVGIIKPFPSIVFKPNKIENAFRLIESRKYIGKILIEFRENSISDQIHPIKMLSQTYFNSNLSYIICDNFNGFGIEFVDWLVVRGARKLVLCLNGNEMNSYFKYRMSVWKKYGTKLVLHSDEIQELPACSSILTSAVKLLGDIGGIFILNNNFHNNKPFNQLTIDDFKYSVQTKSNVVQHMDVVSQKIAKQLKYFIVFSTIACNEGCAWQTSSALANSICERIIEKRVLHKQPGLIIQWGSIQDNNDDKLLEQGILNQEIRSCLSQLDTILLSNDIIISSKVIDKQILNNNNNNDNYFDSIMKLFDCENWKLLPKNTKLFEMGLNSLTSLEFYYIIQKKLQLKLNLKQIKSLTLFKLKELIDKETVIRQNDEKLIYTNETKDIKILLKQFGDLTNNYDRLLTPPNKSTIKMCSVLIIPGIEGIAGNKWYNIASKLNSKASFLQIAKTKDLDSIEEIVNNFLPDAKNALKNSEKFFLIAYSFGALIALELASQLEKLNYTGKILLIDGAPNFFKELFNQNFGENFNEKDLYDIVLTEIIIQMYPDENMDKIQSELKLINSIDNKWNKFLDYIKEQTTYSHEYVEIMTKIVIERLLILINKNNNNNNNYLINSPITLVRPNEVSVVDIDEDYELSKLTKNKIDIRYIDGNHSTILNNSELIEIINECDPIEKEKFIFQSYLQSDVVFEKDYKC